MSHPSALKIAIMNSLMDNFKEESIKKVVGYDERQKEDIKRRQRLLELRLREWEKKMEEQAYLESEANEAERIKEMKILENKRQEDLKELAILQSQLDRIAAEGEKNKGIAD